MQINFQENTTKERRGNTNFLKFNTSEFNGPGTSASHLMPHWCLFRGAERPSEMRKLAAPWLKNA
jgi:hypothetical protein